MITILLTAAIATLTISDQAEPSPDSAAGWPQWRGANRDGISPDSITVWPPTKLWERNVGYGVSSVIASGGRMYAMGHEEGNDTVWCLAGESGEVIWRYSYPAKRDQTSDVRFPGPRATPVFDGKAVYTLSLEGRLHCLDALSATLVWTRTPEEMGASDKQQYGVCCPPLVHQNMVICDVATRCVALDKASGTEIWRTAGGGGWNGAAPMIARFGGRTCMLHGTGRCVDVATGRERWRVPYGEMSVATPIVSGDRVFLSPFHGRKLGGRGCALIRSDGGPPTVVWNNDQVEGLCGTGVLWQGHLYAPDRDDLSIAGETGRKMNLKCIELATGELKWVERPIPWPTPIIAGGRLLIQTLYGELILAQASPEAYKERGRLRVLRGRCWTVPALADGKLYCRNNRGDVVCLRVSE